MSNQGQLDGNVIMKQKTSLKKLKTGQKSFVFKYIIKGLLSSS